MIGAGSHGPGTLPSPPAIFGRRIAEGALKKVLKDDRRRHCDVRSRSIVFLPG